MYCTEMAPTDLSAAKLGSGDFKSADFTGAVLSNSDLESAYLPGAVFADAVVAGASGRVFGPLVVSVAPYQAVLDGEELEQWFSSKGASVRVYPRTEGSATAALPAGIALIPVRRW